LSLTCRAEQSWLLGADDRIVLRFLVDLEPVHILLRYRHIGEDRLDRALREACVAIYARVRVDQKLVGQFVKCFDGTNGRTIGVLTFDAWLGNNIGHRVLKPLFRRLFLRVPGDVYLSNKSLRIAGVWYVAKIKIKP
jgi:hypothetical protein